MDTYQSNSMNEAYFDRNQAVQLLARLAKMLGCKVGLRDNADEPGWTILFIDFGKLGGVSNSQLSWHLPVNEIVGKWPEFPDKWDGHDLKEKRNRIKQILGNL